MTIITNTIWKTKVIWEATNITVSNHIEIIQQTNGDEITHTIVGGVVFISLIVSGFWFLSKVFK